MSTKLSLGATLRKARNAAGLTLDGVVYKLQHEAKPGITTTISYLSRLEGDKALIREPILNALAKLYAIDGTELLLLIPAATSKPDSVSFSIPENRELSGLYTTLGGDVFRLGEALYEQFRHSESLEAYLAAQKLFTIANNQTALRKTLYRIGASYLTLAAPENNLDASRTEIATLARKSIESLSLIYTGELADVDEFIYSGKSAEEYLAATNSLSLADVVLYGSSLAISARAHYILAHNSTEKGALRVSFNTSWSAVLFFKWVVENLTASLHNTHDSGNEQMNQRRLLASTLQKLAIVIREVEFSGVTGLAGFEQDDWKLYFQQATTTQTEITQDANRTLEDLKTLVKFHKTYDELLNKSALSSVLLSTD